MENTIYLIGEIGTDVTLIKVIDSVKKLGEINELNVVVNSIGGFVDDGFEIYDYLKSLKIPITTIGSEVVASIATVIFSAGDKRILKENTIFMIHLPSVSVENAVADELEAYSSELKKYEDKIIKHYTTNNNLTKEAITPLLHKETFLSVEEAISLGFATDKAVQAQAKLFFKTIKNPKNMNITKEFIEAKFNALLDALKNKAKNIMINDTNGNTLEFSKLKEDEMPKIGDEATVDGKPAEGDYLLEDGTTFVFKAGKLEEIKEEEEEKEKEGEEVENLKTEISDLKRQLQDKENSINSFENKLKELKKQITSQFNAEQRTKNVTKSKDAIDVIDAKSIIDNIRKNRK